jgi:hypothetical protein
MLQRRKGRGRENARYFREAGGERFAAIPCLNDSAQGVAVIEAVARRELKGWAGRCSSAASAESDRRSAYSLFSGGRD